MNSKKLIVAATKNELAPLFSHYNLPDESFIQSVNFDILITGVGMTATAFALGRYLNATYSLVLNVGIAGSFDQKFNLGDLVNINTDIFAEFGAEDHSDFIEMETLGFGKNRFNSTATNELLMIDNLPKATAITVNKVHGNEQSIASIKKRLNPQLESMEGAAVFYACEQAHIQCLQVRSISNYVTERNTANWEIKLAIKNLNIWLIDYLSTVVTK